MESRPASSSHGDARLALQPTDQLEMRALEKFHAPDSERRWEVEMRLRARDQWLEFMTHMIKTGLSVEQVVSTIGICPPEPRL